MSSNVFPGRHVCSVPLFFISALWLSSCGGGNSSPPPPPNPVPTLSRVTPNSATVGSTGVTVTASGSGFIPASVIVWNGGALGTTYVSSTSLTAQVPASDFSSAGMANLAIQNPPPGGGTSGAVSFTIANPTPTVTSISPSSGTVGGVAFTLTVAGTQFISTSQISWNGSQVLTTYVSSTSLTAQIPASDLSAVGTAMPSKIHLQVAAHPPA